MVLLLLSKVQLCAGKLGDKYCQQQPIGISLGIS